MTTLAARLVLLAFAAALSAPPAGAGIDGEVIDDAGGIVPGAQVSLTDEANRLVRTADSDDGGHFALAGLPAGRFRLVGSKAGYATRSYGQAGQADMGVVIVLGSDARFAARIRLARLGAITGRILDENGAPASTLVRAARFTVQNGVRTLQDRALAVEADRQGGYRFSDVPPGDYVVSTMGPDGELRRMTPGMIQAAALAAQQPTLPLPPGEAGRESIVSYVLTYYPGVASSASATAVTVAPGDERREVNLQLQITSTVRIDGTVFGQDGQPLPYANVRLLGSDDGVVWSYGASSPTGYFRMAPVPAGSYRLVVYGQQRMTAPGPRAVTVGQFATMDLVANPGGPTTVAVRLEPGVTIAGRVVFDGTTPPPDFTRMPLRLGLLTRDVFSGVAFPGDLSAAVDAQGWVTFAGVPPGRVTLSSSPQLPAGWTIESAVLNGQDILDQPIDVRPREDLSGLVITVTDRRTELAGTIAGWDAASSPENLTVVIFSADRRNWTPGARRVRTVRPDSEGHYQVRGLPPGAYLVSAVRDLDAETGLDAATLAAFQSTAARVTIGGRSPFPQISPLWGQGSLWQLPSGALSPKRRDLWKRAPSPY
jgi:hypothetical protein